LDRFSLEFSLVNQHACGMVSMTVLLSCMLSSRALSQSEWQGPSEDGTRPALMNIVGRGLDSSAYGCLAELSDDIGGRVTGSSAAQKAILWGVARMHTAGLANVHTEPWNLWKGWQRGGAGAEMTAPIHRTLYVDSMGWTGSTGGGAVDADVVPVNLFKVEEEMNSLAHFHGKVILMRADGGTQKSLGVLMTQYGAFLRKLQGVGVVAVIGSEGGFKSQGMHLTHTGSLVVQQESPFPVLSIAAEDQGQMERFLDAGKPVRIHLNVQNTFTNGPVPSANVVGEITGTEHPEQIVALGAHLDSWDLSEGTTDNGTNVCSVLAAADALVKSGIRPRRTIRFVLFTGEEQGELGSKAYVTQHRDEMKDHIAAIVTDSGQGPISEAHLGRSDVVAAFDPFAKALKYLRNIKVNDRAEFGTDSGPFILAGVPGITLEQDSPDYKYTHHSAADALEAAQPETLALNATIMAMTSYWLADRPARFAAPWSPEKTARMLREQGAYDRLKAVDMWPFGDLGEQPKVP
jgi:carboxypeptidase Q